MNDWMEVFKAGSYGDKGTYSESDLDHICKTYDPAFHQAPITIGHPSDNSESFGWVEALRRDGKTLLAKVKNWAPEFLEKVKAGRYRKRSISLYNDLRGRGLYLRHIGFVPVPECKGLADLSFLDQQSKVVSFEFVNDSNQKGEINMSEKSAYQLLKSVMDFSESESDEISSKIERARQQIKREYTSGPVLPVAGVEQSIAAQVLADEQKIPFGRALAQVKGANLEQ